MTNTKQIVLASRPKGLPSIENFRFEDVNLKTLGVDEVLLKPTYISVDPYMRGRMSEAKSYAPPFDLNEPIVGGMVAEVIESKSPNYKKGEKVIGMLPWATLLVAKVTDLQKIDESLSLPESYYLGILGMPGQTAYIGITDICKPQRGETVIVSGAAGSVGTIAGQIAKIKGARVVGITGSDEKMEMLKNRLKFDEVINYKTADMKKAIAKACPLGIDCYYDNVGGEVSDIVMSYFNTHSRAAICGQISLYNRPEISTINNILPHLLKSRSTVTGFLVSDHKDGFEECNKEMTKWVVEGKLINTETVIEGFDELPNAFLGLFTGSNIGKMIVKTKTI